jgi:parvulin-like peptidyl-prolyl isomerase
MRSAPCRASEGRLSSHVLLLTALLAVGGCGYLSDGGERAIAEIAGETVSRAAFDDYVRSILVDEPGQASEPPSPELLSRLLDRFLEEELLVREAERRGILVEEREITEALRDLRNPELVSTTKEEADYQRLRDRVRRALLAQKFREERVLKGLSVSIEEIAAYYEAHRDEFQTSARVVLRQILLEDPEEATALRRELLRSPGRFQEIAEERSMAPDGGRARAYDESDLPPDLIEAIAPVPEGGISKVATSAFGSRVFLVEKREAEREISVEEAYERIRVLLLQEKSRRAYEMMMSTLREQAGVVIREENVPFAYRKRES